MSRRVGSFSGFPRSLFESKDSITTSPPAIDTAPPGNASGRKGLPESEWARPDLDWRPPGYQPGAPTGLSYGPTAPARFRTANKLWETPRRRLPSGNSRESQAAPTPKALLSHFEIRRAKR